MLKKSAVSLVLFSIFSYTHASTTCPEPINIRLNTLYGWKAYDIENGTRVSQARYDRFAQAIDSFALTEWISTSNPSDNQAHCYYYGKKKDESYLGVYLQKEKQRPDKASHGWKGWGTDYMRCDDNLYECRFVEE